MSDPKTKPSNQSVDNFLNSVENEQMRTDAQQIKLLMEKITGEKAKMWGESIVGFGSYQYKYASGREGEWMLVGFSPRKQNLTMYIMSGFQEYDKQGLMGDYLDKLGKYKTGKSCLYIKSLDDVDVEVLEKLIRASVKQMRETNS